MKYFIIIMILFTACTGYAEDKVKLEGVSEGLEVLTLESQTTASLIEMLKPLNGVKQ